MTKKRILVIDNEDNIRSLLEDILVSEGFDVVLAHNGVEGLEKVKETSPNLILLDIRMPGLDGFEILKVVRERYDIPVIMLTGDVASIRDAINVGADDYVTKPFNEAVLLMRIKAKLRRVS